VTSDVAIVVVTEINRGGGILPDGSKALPGSGRLTYVLVKRRGVWKITHGHNTTIDPNALRFDPVNGDRTGEAPKP
jgi:ketosteroid isomerase-like protein